MRLHTMMLGAFLVAAACAPRRDTRDEAAPPATTGTDTVRAPVDTTMTDTTRRADTMTTPPPR